MKRITNIDAEYKTTAKKAIEKFFKRYPEHKEDWEETYYYMVENNVEKFCDDMFACGVRNADWSYCLLLECGENYTYIALIERV